MARNEKSKRIASSSSDSSSSSSDEIISSLTKSQLKNEVSRQQEIILSMQRKLEESRKEKDRKVNEVNEHLETIRKRYLQLTKKFEEKAEKNKVLLEEKKDHRDSHQRMQ